MKLAELHAHPAWQDLSPDEQAAVTARLADWHLDGAAIAAASGALDQLEADDLRTWLAAGAQRPWAGLTLLALPQLADSLLAALLELAPSLAEAGDRAERVQQARALSRALVVTEQERRASGILREEQLGALQHRIEALGVLDRAWGAEAIGTALCGCGLEDLAAALEAHRRSTRGLQGLLDRLADRLDTGRFDLVQAGLTVATGTPGHEGRFHDGQWRNWTSSYRVRPRRFHLPASEAELSRVIARAAKLRVVGGGHSFNDSPLCDDEMRPWTAAMLCWRPTPSRVSSASRPACACAT